MPSVVLMDVEPAVIVEELEFLLTRSLAGCDKWVKTGWEDWKKATAGTRRLISGLRGYKNEWGYSDAAVELAQARYTALVYWRIACNEPHSTPETRARFVSRFETASSALYDTVQGEYPRFNALAYLASSENE